MVKPNKLIDKTTGQFNTLRNQKNFEQENDQHTTETGSQNKEDSNFMARKPGQSETLPGWGKVKDLTDYTS